MGYAIRTRVIAMLNGVWNNGEVVARELYDYKTDVSETENCIDKLQYAGPKKTGTNACGRLAGSKA